MQLKQLKLVTIVAELILEPRLIDMIKACGATGYTVANTHGDGSRGARRGSVHGENIQIEVIATEPVAHAIMTELAHKYFEKYACIAWLVDVAVMRGAKYEK